MEISGPYRINGKEYSREELLLYGQEQVKADGIAAWQRALWRFILEFFDESVPLIQKTSGTTGDPKSLILLRPSMLRSAEMTLRHFNLREGDNILLCLPVEYIAGKMMVVRALAGGLNLIAVEPSSSPLKGAEGAIQFAAMVPLQLHESLRESESAAKIGRIGKLLIGGAEIHQVLRAAIAKLGGVAVYESFAMSETYTHFAVRRINGDAPEPHFTAMEEAEIGTDRNGCLTVNIPGITGGTVVTNDLVRITGPGKFEWLGRVDHLINSGGVKIVPEIIEKRIADIMGREVLVVGVDDQKLGNRLILLVEGDKTDRTDEEWISMFSRVLSRHEVPKEILHIPEFPRNRSMKIDRVAAKKMVIG